ncbi:hypothetical protein [Mycobacterium colombiense]|uniref:Alanine and proline rich membrane protein n=1 Tax=Mycobacterium colombiense TaxID=339268 RepID=A0A853LWZ1_9MYCO|nr:hypothetical protein [Mycobacterium colombiense]OBJ09887.1 hypothetical protein A5623_27405 [Mycobacterium colombiense]OBJ58493.1 hypothetical protein A5628_13695 [Mycobacterium colombiense]
MVGDSPSNQGEKASFPPPAGSWPPPHFPQPVSRPRPWLAITVALTAAIAVAALVVALTRPKASKPAATTTTPNYSAADTGAAQKMLCDAYKLVARAVEVDTSGNDKALARIADTNGAVMLEMASAAPALDTNHREAARALALAYGTVTAMGNSAIATDADYRAALDDVIAKDAAMRKVCGGG